MTPSQPQLFVGYSSPVYDDEGTIIAGAKLSVHRSYKLPNQWGGTGRSKPLDADGKLFDSLHAARQYALEHGYLQPFFRTYSPAKKEQRRQTFLKQIKNKLLDLQPAL
jgi:hypothetical protein